MKAVRGLAVGDYTGGLTVLDDDPTPTLTVVPVATSVEEGADLVWTLRLSDVTDVGVFVALTPTAPGPGLPPELDTKDVPADWLTEHEVDPPGRAACCPRRRPSSSASSSQARTASTSSCRRSPTAGPRARNRWC